MRHGNQVRAPANRTPQEDNLEHGKLPDPEGQAIADLTKRVAELEGIVRSIAEEKVRI